MSRKSESDLWDPLCCESPLTSAVREIRLRRWEPEPSNPFRRPGRGCSGYPIKNAFAIDLTAMTDFDHLYDPCSVIYSVYHTVVALANTITTLGTCKLLTSHGARFPCERRNSSNNAPAISLGANSINLLRG